MEGDTDDLSTQLDADYFNPLPPHGGRQDSFWRTFRRCKHFNPLPPHGGRLYNNADGLKQLEISIHSLRMEGDFCGSSLDSCSRLFQSTPSAWRETLSLYRQNNPRIISIHSLRMEGDGGRENADTVRLNISIHSLRMEGDGGKLCAIIMPIVFQSTPSAWRETDRVYIKYTPTADFNPLPPHGGRRNPSLRHFRRLGISIHSLRMEGDMRRCRRSQPGFHFNPLPPHGGRQAIPQIILELWKFQSTPSAWRETYTRVVIPRSRRFQSTPSAWRETVKIVPNSVAVENFNPLPPHGGRPGTGRNAPGCT